MLVMLMMLMLRPGTVCRCRCRQLVLMLLQLLLVPGVPAVHGHAQCVLGRASGQALHEVCKCFETADSR